MKNERTIRGMLCAWALLAGAHLTLAGASGGKDAATCNVGPPRSAPTAAISNGLVDAVVYLPDAQTGYYRATRFDWSGVVGCLTYKGHTYFGVWFPRYDPHLHDSITGPVEDFRSADGESAFHYDAARPGGPFVKLGVGVLRRVDNKPFNFATTYPTIDAGQWSVHAGPDRVLFQQILQSPVGIAYVYKKTLRLEAHQPELLIEHELKNTGTETIDTQVYNHDFFVLDGAPTGPEMRVRFAFEPRAGQPLTNGARLDGKELVFGRELEPGEFVYTLLSGFSPRPSDFDFTVENRATGMGVEESADRPLARIVFWSIRTTVCPEGYVHIRVAPGETAHWTLRYRFFAR